MWYIATTKATTEGFKGSLSVARKMTLCLDCQKGISVCSLRCKSCAGKLRDMSKLKPVPFKSGIFHPNWKGDKVGYHALHEWVKNHLPKTCWCEICNKIPPYDLANKSGKYLRDLKDWQWLCRRCHVLSDGRMKIIHSKISKEKRSASAKNGWIKRRQS